MSTISTQSYSILFNQFIYILYCQIFSNTANMVNHLTIGARHTWAECLGKSLPRTLAVSHQRTVVLLMLNGKIDQMNCTPNQRCPLIRGVMKTGFTAALISHSYNDFVHQSYSTMKMFLSVRNAVGLFSHCDGVVFSTVMGLFSRLWWGVFSTVMGLFSRLWSVLGLQCFYSHPYKDSEITKPVIWQRL